MKCKYCDADLVEGKPFCPSCGKDNTSVDAAEETAPVQETPAAEIPAAETPVEEAAKPVEMKEGIKMTPGKLALAIVAGVVVVAIVIALIVSGMNGSSNETLSTNEQPTGTTEETVAEETVAATIPADGNPDDVTCKGTYTVTDEEVIAAADTVVATMDDKVLTNAELQVYYWMEVWGFLSDYGSYAAYFGMDYTQPLDTQLCEDGSENPMTWQQYFLARALDNWMSYQSLAIEADENDFVMDEEFAEYLAALPEQLETNAASAGLADSLELVQANVGPGADVDDYVKYIEMYYTGYNYFNKLYEQIQPTAEEIEAYFAENEESYTEAGITTEDIQVDVRHILIQVEGGTTDDEGNTTYSDEEWEACRLEAQAILEEWLAGDATEDTFAALANEKSEDGGSNTNGGLYTGVTEGYMVDTFNDWCFDESRVVGDYGLVKTTFGYHVMFFSGSESVWYATAEADLIDERAAKLLPDCVERHPATIDYSLIKLGFVNLAE